jgi:hypothetical protein
MHHHDDLEIPAFLRRNRTKEEQRAISLGIIRRDTAAREWAPIRKRSEWTVTPPPPLHSEQPDLPVKVQVKDPKHAGSTLLATYANMAEFEAKHNKVTYPVKGQPVVFGRHTLILVTAKPWADKEKNATKREGPKASAVNVDGVIYDSVLAAFTALTLPVNKHQTFRALLKKERSKPFIHEGKSFAFTYDLDAKQPQPAPVVKKQKPATKKAKRK